MKSMFARWVSLLAAIGALLVLAACAAPTVINTQWADPQFSAKPIRSVMVIGVVKDSTNRRTYEDNLVAMLASRGIKAVPSYRYAPEAGAVSQQKMEQVVRESGVAGVLLTRVVNISQSLQVSPGMFMGPGVGGFRGFYGAYVGMWASSLYVPPAVYTEENLIADTQLFETREFKMVWSASTTTSLGYNSVPDIIQQFASLIVGALATAGLV